MSIKRFLCATFKGLVSHQPSADLDVLICHAEMARSGLQKFSRSLAQTLKLDAHNLSLGDIKETERIIAKARERYNGNIDRICDICRERIFFERPEDVIEFRRLFLQGNKSPFFKDSLGKGCRILEIEDYFASPRKSGFIGINIQLEIDLGKGRKHVAELQLMHKDMVDADKTSRKWFEEIRALEEKKALGQITSDEENNLAKLNEANTALYAAESARLGLGVLRVNKSEWKPKYPGLTLEAA